MEKSSIEKILSQLLNEVDELATLSLESPKFKSWETKVHRRLITIYGEESVEFRGFWEIGFHKPVKGIYLDPPAFEVEQAYFSNCLDEARMYFAGLIEELELLPKANFSEESSQKVSKIFVSHSSEDKKLVSEIVHLLSLIGVQDSSIFCTSLEGYGIPLGDNWLQTLKSEVSGEVIVLFVISPNYFDSQISLCEMGAAWVLSKKHIPILVPPVEFTDMQAVIPLTQGFKVDNKHRWTQLKSQLEGVFNLSPKSPQIWESRRDEILSRIELLIQS